MNLGKYIYIQALIFKLTLIENTYDAYEKKN